MGGKLPRAPRGKTVSFDNLEALFSKKALEAYILGVEEQKEWPEGNMFSREEVLSKLESVVEKIDSLPYFSPSKAMQPMSGIVSDGLNHGAEIG
jgi:hypothetical protein